MIKLNKNEVLRYLGYGGQQIDNDLNRLIDNCILECENTIYPNHCYMICDISILNDVIILEKYNYKIKSKDLSNHLKGCNKLVLICYTLGIKFDFILNSLLSSDNTKAIIYDSCGTAMVEEYADSITVSDGNLTSRFSPGYGDLDIQYQQMFIDLLKIDKKLGVCLTQSCLLTPAKSVTAIIGISENKIEIKHNKCEYCNLKGNCTFRKKGTVCGNN